MTQVHPVSAKQKQTHALPAHALPNVFLQSGQEPLLPENVENKRTILSILIIMAFLACIALLFARGASRLSAQWQAELRNSATVQILIGPSQNRHEIMEEAALAISQISPESEITILSDKEARALLTPWLGTVNLPQDLTIPALLTIKSKTDKVALEQIRSALNAINLEFTIDDHSHYSAGLKRSAKSLRAGSLAILILILSASIAMNIFATRTGLIAQRSIINILVQVGASNPFIAKLFIMQAVKRASFGAALGAIAALIIWLFLSLGHYNIYKDFGFTWSGWISGFKDGLYVLGLSIFFIVICALAAGITAQRQLLHERRKR